MVNEAAGTIADSHTYADNGTYVVTVTVKDKGPTADSDGDSDTKHFNVTVNNVAPQWDRSGSLPTNQDVNEGSSLVVNGSFTDPGFNNALSHPPTVETFTYFVDWGDGSQTQAGAVMDVVQGKAGVLTKGTVHLNLQLLLALGELPDFTPGHGPQRPADTFCAGQPNGE